MIRYCELGSLPVRIIASRASRREVVEAPAQFGHWCVDGEQILRRDRTQSDDDFRLDDRDLPHQKRQAGVTFIALRSAVSRRTALNDVGNVDVFAADAHRFDHVVEQLTGTTDKGLALQVFISARAFPDEHEFRTRIADSEDDLLASLLMELAALAVAEVFADQLERSNRVGGLLLRFRRQDFEDVFFGNRCDHRGLS